MRCVFPYFKNDSLFSNIWFPTATLFNAENCSTLGNQSIHTVEYFYKQKAHLVKRNFIFRIWVKLPLKKSPGQRNTKHYDFSKK
jgi:hypothetical protein